MTKQVDVLLGESKGIEKKSTASSGSTKKEGASFFDTMLADAKVKTSTKSSVETTSKQTDTKTTQPTVAANKEQKTSTSKTSSEVEKSNDNKNEKSVEIKKENKVVENKSETVKEQSTQSKNTSTSSLLDRMVVEAKQVVQKQSDKVITDETKQSDKKLKEKVLFNKNEKHAALSKQEDKSLQKDIANKNNASASKEIEEDMTKIQKSESLSDKQLSKKAESSIKIDKNSEVKENAPILEEKEKVTVKDQKSAQKDNTTFSKVELSENKQAQQETVEVKQNNTVQNKAVSEQVEKQSIEIKKSVNPSVTVDKQAEVVNKSKDNITLKATPKTVENTTSSVENNIEKPQVKGTVETEKTLQKETVNQETKQDEPQQFDKQTEKQSNNKTVLQENKVLDNSKATVSEQAKNQKAAHELAKLNQSSSEEVNVSKQSLLNSEVKEEKKQTSLLDKLINETKAKIENQNTNANESATVAKEQKVDKLLNNEVLTNIYLSTRNKKVEDKSLETLHKGKTQALNAKNVADVQESAKTLDLGLKETSVESKPVTTQTSEVLDRNLQRLAFAKNYAHTDISNLEVYSKKVSKEASKAVLSETVVNLNVSAQNVQNITQRIIGARQQMSSMMSDIAREMYSNYKPPVTAFRLNLQPAHLGSIAIMIKSDRESTISISMNMSNSATLDAMTDNQGSLRSALNKSFGQENQFNLDFGMQDDQQSGNGDHNAQQNSQNQTRQQTSTEGILEAREENKEELLMNYM